MRAIFGHIYVYIYRISLILLVVAATADDDENDQWEKKHLLMYCHYQNQL